MPASPSAVDPPRAVTADDLQEVVRGALIALEGVPDDAWEASAGGLKWDRWETVEHLSDDLFSYALQLGPASPRPDSVVPVAWKRKTPDGPASVIFVDRTGGSAALLEVLESCAALLSAMVQVTPADVRSHHAFGVTDAEGFAAMGIVETLVHVFDVTRGLSIEWTPSSEVCRLVVDRLFPEAPRGEDPWGTLLWATGRADLPGRSRPTPGDGTAGREWSGARHRDLSAARLEGRRPSRSSTGGPRGSR
jgi:hypothetical protein